MLLVKNESEDVEVVGKEKREGLLSPFGGRFMFILFVDILVAGSGC